MCCGVGKPLNWGFVVFAPKKKKKINNILYVYDQIGKKTVFRPGPRKIKAI